ncbi:unnamed protein product [Ectocarpus fasciculatus]
MYQRRSNRDRSPIDLFSRGSYTPPPCANDVAALLFPDLTSRHADKKSAKPTGTSRGRWRFDHKPSLATSRFLGQPNQTVLHQHYNTENLSSIPPQASKVLSEKNTDRASGGGEN